MFGKKKTIVWTSSKTSPENAAKQLANEQDKMAKKGYALESQSFVEAGRSKKSWVALGALNLARAKQVQVVATFRLKDHS
jgi:hypothetical protein